MAMACASPARERHTITIKLWPGQPRTLWDMPGIGEAHFLFKPPAHVAVPDDGVPDDGVPGRRSLSLPTSW